MNDISRLRPAAARLKQMLDRGSIHAQWFNAALDDDDLPQVLQGFQ